jgi:hypothetical protein
MTFVAGHNPTNLEGFEWADTEAPRNNEMATASAAVVAFGRTGSYSLEVFPGTSENYMEIPLRFASSGEVHTASDFQYVSARFYGQLAGNSLASEGIFFTLCNGAPASVIDRIWLSFNSAGKILIKDGGGTLAGPSTIAWTGGSWHLLEVFAGPTEITVRLDGTEELTATGSFQAYDSCMFGARVAQTGGYFLFVDDFITETSVTSATAIDWPGPGAIERVLQDSDVLDGSFLNEAASATNLYQSIDETTAPDGDTTYVRSTTAQDAYRVGFETAASAGVSGIISAVKVQTRARNEATSPNLATRVRSTAGTDSDTSNQNFALAYQARQSVVFKTPPGAAAGTDWATADIDALEVGAKIGSNVATAVRVTEQVVQVDFNTGTTPSTFRAKVNPETLGGKLALIPGDVVGA